MERYISIYKEGKIPKEIYDKRRDSFYNRMNTNKTNVKGLNDNQYNLLINIAKMRHEIHSNPKQLYNSESSNYKEYSNWLDEINNKLTKNKLPKIKWSVDLDALPNSIDRYENIISNTDEAEEKNLSLFYSEHNKINEDIENYLGKIDKKYKSNFKPTGVFRERITT